MLSNTGACFFSFPGLFWNFNHLFDMAPPTIPSTNQGDVVNCSKELKDITWPRGDTKSHLECWKIFHEWGQRYFTNEYSLCYPLLSLVTLCYPLLPLIILCYPLLPLLPLVTFVTPCYPLLPLLPLATPCYPLLPLVALVTPCYPC